MVTKNRAQVPALSDESWDTVLSRWFPRLVVDETTGCMVWTGCTNRDGYAKVKIDGVNLYLHRVLYALAHGGIDPEMELDHRGADGTGCISRACCNPDHLEEVTHAENLRRISERTLTLVA